MSKTKKLPSIQNPDSLNWITERHKPAAELVNIHFAGIRRLRYQLLNEPAIRRLYESFPVSGVHQFFTEQYTAGSLLRSFDYALLGEDSTLANRKRTIEDRAYDFNIPAAKIWAAFNRLEELATEAKQRTVSSPDNSRDAIALTR